MVPTMAHDDTPPRLPQDTCGCAAQLLLGELEHLKLRGLGVVFPLLPPLLSLLVAKFVQLDPPPALVVNLVGDLFIDGEWLPDLLIKVPPPPFFFFFTFGLTLLLAPKDGDT